MKAFGGMRTPGRISQRSELHWVEPRHPASTLRAAASRRNAPLLGGTRSLYERGWRGAASSSSSSARALSVRDHSPISRWQRRVGRLIVPLLLCSYERLEGPTLYLSPYFERHRTRYTDLMLRVSQTVTLDLGFVSSWRPWTSLPWSRSARGSALTVARRLPATFAVGARQRSAPRLGGRFVRAPICQPRARRQAPGRRHGCVGFVQREEARGRWNSLREVTGGSCRLRVGS